jgi:hypothetical protein
MQQRKRVRDYSALTPDISGPEYLARPPLTKSEVEALRSENRKLLKQIAYLLKKHESVEDALARHIATQQQLLTGWKNAIVLMGAELKPTGRV